MIIRKSDYVNPAPIKKFRISNFEFRIKSETTNKHRFTRHAIRFMLYALCFKFHASCVWRTDNVIDITDISVMLFL